MHSATAQSFVRDLTQNNMAATMATSGARDSLTAKSPFNYDSFTKKCETYVSANENTAKDIKCFLKALYGSVKEAETADGLSSGETLPELIIDNFDDEQIWQELELQNEARVDLLVGNVARLVAQKDRFSIDTGPSVKNGGKKNLQNGNHEDDEGEDEDENEVEDEDDIELEDDEELRKLKGIAFDDDDSDLSMPDGEEDEEEDDDGDDVEEEENVDLNEDGDEESEENEKPQKKSKAKAAPAKKKGGMPSIVDDKFFKLSEMEAFLEKEEAEDDDDNEDSEGDSDEESVDLFKDFPSDEDDENEDDENDDDDDDDTASQSDKKQMRYSDFFDAPDGETPEESSKPKSKGTKPGKDKKVKFSFGGESEEESDSGASETSDLNVPSKNEIKSSYEIRQERLQAKIKKLEDQAVSDKPWQHAGEISGTMRPENALLEEALEFDLTHRPAPVVTEETTQRLEDIIKQRIKDRAWDDVERKQKPVEAPSEFKKKLVLDQEKSKVSLAQVYEQEYLKQVAAAEPESDKPDEIPKEHVEITTLVDSLFRKLDALSNFHYTPKQVAPEVKIVTNIPAINMEEVAPVATSDATMLAPEEVKAKPKGDVKSQGEKTDTDRKRERRQKKKHQKLKSRDREQKEAAVAKLRPGLGNKYSKEKAVKLIEKVAKDSNVKLIENSHSQSLKSSTAFFNQLQDEVATQNSEKANLKKRKNNTKTMSAKRVKL